MYCGECGTKFNGNFCPNCGAPSPFTRMNPPVTGIYKNSFIEKGGYSGIDYENMCAKYLVGLGFSGIETTKKSGDQGVDIIAHKNGYKYAIQCKYYNAPVGNSAIQEVVAGAAYYNCNKKMVITNNSFTKSAMDLAKTNDVTLMPNITENAIKQSLSMGKTIDFMSLYAPYKHVLPEKDYFRIYVSHNGLEKLYQDKVSVYGSHRGKGKTGASPG